MGIAEEEEEEDEMDEEKRKRCMKIILRKVNRIVLEVIEKNLGLTSSRPRQTASLIVH